MSIHVPPPTSLGSEQDNPHNLYVPSPHSRRPNRFTKSAVSEPGFKFYSHLSDQYGYFSILPISPTESEAAYVLDGLFDHDSILDIEELFTDTGGASDHVFALFAPIGRRFAPRLRNLP